MNGLKAPMNWGMPSTAMPVDYASMSSYGALPPVDYGLNYGGGYSGTGFNPDSMGGLGFQANGASLATPNLTGGMNGGIGLDGGWNWLNTRDQQGVLGPALAGAQSLASLFMGMKQYGLAKDALANSKSQFERQYAANKQTTNNEIENRYSAAAARGTPGQYQSVSDYMKTHGVA